MPKSTAPKRNDPPGTLDNTPPEITDVWSASPADQMAADMQKNALNRGEDPKGAEEFA